jgi:2-iminobutanoate/2-iminopropanoate deaminase
MKILISSLAAVIMLCNCKASIHDPDQQSITNHKIQSISVDGMPSLGPYSSAVKANGMLYVSGIIALNPETNSFAQTNIEAQTKQIFANLKRILEVTGSSTNDIVKTSIYLKNPEDFTKMNEIYSTYFPNYKPARTTVPGVNWGREDILIEIDFIVMLP